jgi:hypothetical protein
MGHFVSATIMPRRATVRIRRRYFEHVFIDVVAVNVMQVAVVQIVGMTIVLDRWMAAAGTMLMRVAFDLCASSHIYAPYWKA